MRCSAPTVRTRVADQEVRSENGEPRGDRRYPPDDRFHHASLRQSRHGPGAGHGRRRRPASACPVKKTPRDESSEDEVRVGYGSQDRADVTGAVATVRAEDVGREITSIEDLLQGLAGVTVRRLGERRNLPSDPGIVVAQRRRRAALRDQRRSDPRRSRAGTDGGERRGTSPGSTCSRTPARRPSTAVVEPTASS